MDLQRLSDWESAQAISFSVDLITVAKEQLKFLALVENSPKLLKKSVLQQAIHRYANFWLPLVAKSQGSVDYTLIPPLDCAWIWHCHRLNPLQYARDCKRLFKKLLDAPPVSEDCKDEETKKTEALWKNNFPDESYDLDVENASSTAETCHFIGYNLLDAVSRQQSFYYQVSQPHYLDESFLKAAEQRYKAFLHLMRENKKTFFVPTYDVDLMWHAHQLCPVAYNKDLIKVLGRVLGHDDTDSDRTKGRKLDTGFGQTREIWLKTYDFPYEKAGCMYRGERPEPVPKPELSDSSLSSCQHLFSWEEPCLARRKTLQVRLAVHSARCVPTKNVSSTFLSISTFQNCLEFNTQTPEVKASSSPEWNKLWLLECDSAIGGLVLELRQRTKGILKGVKVVGSLTITWKMIMQSSTLSLNGWFPLSTPEGSNLDEFPSLHLDVSVTPPVDAPHVMKFVKLDRKLFTRENSTLAKVIDHTNKKLYNVDTRSTLEILKTIHVELNKHGQKKPQSNEGPVLVSVVRNSTTKSREWSLYGSSGILAVTKHADGEPEFQITGCFDSPIMLVGGRKLQFELKGARHNQDGFVTVIRYSSEAPNGKATALFNWKTGDIEILPEESSMLVVAFLAATATTMSEMSNEPAVKAPTLRSKSSIDLRGGGGSRFFSWHRRSNSGLETSKGNPDPSSAGCGGGCNGACGALKTEHATSAGGCGSGCGGGCGGCGALNNETTFGSGFGKGISTSASSAGCGAGCGGGGCGGCGAFFNKDSSCKGRSTSTAPGACGALKTEHATSAGGCGSGCGAGGCGALNNETSGFGKGISTGASSAGCGAGCGGGCGGCGSLASEN